MLATLSKLLQAAASKLSIEALRPGRANTFGPDLLLLHPLQLYGESLNLHLHPSPRKVSVLSWFLAQVDGLGWDLHIPGVRLVCGVLTNLKKLFSGFFRPSIVCVNLSLKTRIRALSSFCSSLRTPFSARINAFYF